MSSFICEKCGKNIIDTKDGYISSCIHYPIEKGVNMGRPKASQDSFKFKILLNNETIIYCKYPEDAEICLKKLKKQTPDAKWQIREK